MCITEVLNWRQTVPKFFRRSSNAQNDVNVNAFAKVKDRERDALLAIFHESYKGERIGHSWSCFYCLSKTPTRLIFHFLTELAKMAPSTFSLMLPLFAVGATASDGLVPYGL